MSQSSKSAIYLLAGVIVGVGIGYLLFKEKRADLEHTETDPLNPLEEKIKSIKSKVEEKVEEGSDFIVNQIDELIKEYNLSTPELISLLESRLNELKSTKK